MQKPNALPLDIHDIHLIIICFSKIPYPSYHSRCFRNYK